MGLKEDLNKLDQVTKSRKEEIVKITGTSYDNLQDNNQSFENIKQIIEKDIYTALAIPAHHIYTATAIPAHCIYTSGISSGISSGIVPEYEEKKYITEVTKERIDACIDAIQKVRTAIIEKNKGEKALELAARLEQAKDLLENMQKIIEEAEAAKKEVFVPYSSPNKNNVMYKWDYNTEPSVNEPTYSPPFVDNSTIQTYTANTANSTMSPYNLPIELPSKCKGKITPTKAK